MTDSRAAVGLDRLPWLSDEPARKAPKTGGGISLLGWAVAVLLVVAGLSYWLGIRTARPEVQIPHASTTNTLPPPSARAPSQTITQPPPAPAIEPMVAPPIPIEAISEPEPKVIHRSLKTVQPVRAHRDAAPAKSRAAEDTEPAEPERVNDPLRPWPVRVIDGSSGRLVRIGTFTSAHQAKKAWWAIMRINPALKRLPALVVPVQSLRNGRTYYRLQMGTTSQAHSAVLCQRMRMIGQSCVVIGVESRASEIAM